MAVVIQQQIQYFLHFRYHLPFTTVRGSRSQFWIFLLLGTSPTVIIDPKDKTVREGKGLSLTCAATGKPKPRIKWKKNGRTIMKDDRIQIRDTDTGSKLRIRGSVTQDSGIYRCVAKNHHGHSGSAKATVDVRGVYKR